MLTRIWTIPGAGGAFGSAEDRQDSRVCAEERRRGDKSDDSGDCGEEAVTGRVPGCFKSTEAIPLGLASLSAHQGAGVVSSFSLSHL